MWTVNLFQTVTGNLGPQVEYENFSWSLALNSIEEFSIDMKKSELPKLNLDYWFAPWWAGFVLFWDGNPVFGGPILNITNEDEKTISFGCAGIRAILAKRKIVLEPTNNSWVNISKSFIQYTGLSLGTIAKKVVQQAQAKPSGILPISYPLPDETAANDADHQRTYRAFNIANIDCDAILTKLSNVINGPDILFKPRLVDPNTITFDLWTGTEQQPRIYQSYTPSWDTTAPLSDVSNLRLTTTGAYQSSRVFSTGAGQDEGTLMAVATNYTPLQKQFPILETSISISDSEQAAVVLAHGLANLEMNTNTLQEIQMHVRADGTNPLTSFWPGDLIEITVKGFVTLKDGTHRMRLLAMSGDTSNDVMLNMQTEEKFISTDKIGEDEVLM